MGLLDDVTIGRYVPGDSPLHRLDARLKLCGLPLFIITAFASSDPLRLAALSACALVLVVLAQIPWRCWWRGVRVLRWLLLFTLLLHLLLTPGRTMFGVAWLSYDGLLRGLTVCGQLLTAVIFASLLTLTSSVDELAAALSALLAPLRRFRLPVEEAVRLFYLILYFIPILREEATAQIEAFRNRGETLDRGTLLQRGRLVGRMLAPLILGLVDRADALAHEMATDQCRTNESVAVDFRWTALDWWAVGIGVAMLVLIWWVV